MTKVTVSREMLRQVLDALCAAMEFDVGDAESEVFDAAVELRAALVQPAVEPIGYFRAEPFGWTDCAPTDEGAKALYEVPPPTEPAAEPVKGLFVDLIAQYPGLAEELAAIVIDAPPAEPAVEPRNHVGNSKFESWYSEYNASGKGDKQRARDAYAAGMGDPVYLPPPPPPAEPAPVPLWDIEDLAHAALQEALSYGLGLDLFVRYFKVAQKASPPPPAEPAHVPWLSEEEIGRIFLKFEGSLRSLRDCANEIEKAYRRKAGL